MDGYTNRVCGIGLPNKSSTGKRKRKIDITIGVFFDGTCNNKYNIASGLGLKKRKQYKDEDSYYGSYSNVANLWAMYEEKLSQVDNTQNNFTDKVYIEGIGTYKPNDDSTSSGKKDNTRGASSGKGETGICAKAQRGCEEIIKKITMITNAVEDDVIINTITLDVFGFSRGAAAARHFVGCINKDEKQSEKRYNVCLKRHMKDNNIQYDKITVRFLGLFDTVSSYDPGGFWSWDFEDDIKELTLDIQSNVNKAVQLVAADEWRQNFALTTIDSAKSRGFEIILPGAHSDIGGGYAPVENEPIYMSNMWNEERCWRGYLTFKEITDGQWLSHPLFTNEIGQFMIKVRSKYNSYKLLQRECSIDSVKAEEFMIRRRPVLNDYSRVPLSVMYMYAHDNGCVFNTQQSERRMEIKNSYDSMYNEAFTALAAIQSLAKTSRNLYTIDKNNKIIFTGTPEQYKLIKSIRATFIHLSANNDYSYCVRPHKATVDNKRIIIKDSESPIYIDSPIKGVKSQKENQGIKA